MVLLYKLLKQDPDSREGIITTTSVLGILVNLMVAGAKIIFGMLASSIAIISEGLNNAADVMTSVLTLIGTKLASKHPDAEHPFGYGRIEYFTGLIISVLILFTGAQVLMSSVKLIFNPEELRISYVSLAVVAVSAVIKFLLGTYTLAMGKKADSSALEALGLDSRSDSFLSAVTIISALAFLLFHISIDAYAGIFTSFIILRAGLEVLKSTMSELLGRPGEKELAQRLYKRIRSTEGIINAVDMMLHNYGPDAYSGSVNVEMDHKLTVGEMYQIIHKLQLDIMHEEKVVLVFGIYAVDNDSPYVVQLRQHVANYVKEHEHVVSYHAIYMEPGTDNIYCDLIVDYDLRDWDALDADFKKYMKVYYPDKVIQLTIETEFV